MALHTELGVPPDRRLVGLVNRYHPMKDHATFLRAARRVLDAGVDASFVCAGREVTPSNPELSGLAAELALGGRLHLLGERTDTPALFAALDLACMTSAWGEGFRT